MKRKVLTFTNELGEQEDLIPYVDDLAIKIGGTNLKDYLSQIEETSKRASLFLGAIESETALLEKYPNGSDLKVGTYAIVADRDAIYIYDTDTSRWLQTYANISGILQLNGLTAINGSLTITGGDIEATVSNAGTPKQTITAHLDTLYNLLMSSGELKLIQNDNNYVNIWDLAYGYYIYKHTGLNDTELRNFEFVYGTGKSIIVGEIGLVMIFPDGTTGNKTYTIFPGGGLIAYNGYSNSADNYSEYTLYKTPTLEQTLSIDSKVDKDDLNNLANLNNYNTFKNINAFSDLILAYGGVFINNTIPLGLLSNNNLQIGGAGHTTEIHSNGKIKWIDWDNERESYLATMDDVNEAISNSITTALESDY